MKKEKVLVSRDEAAINAHRKRIDGLVPKYQHLVLMYRNLKLDTHSESLPEIIKNSFTQCREQVRKSLPPALKDTDAVETITLNGEKEFFAYLDTMRKNGELEVQGSFNLARSGVIEINQAALDQFVNENSLWLTDLTGKELLENVVQALNSFEDYAKKNYINASLVNTAMDGGVHLNPRWRICGRDKKGNLTLNLQTLAMFESNRQ